MHLLTHKYLVSLTLCLALVLLFIADEVIANESQPIPIIKINSAQFIASSSQAPPSFENAKTVMLPHKWNATDYSSGWFELTWQQQPVDENLSIFLPRLNMNATVYLNGELIGNGGRTETPVARHWHSPMFFILPASLIKEGINNIQIRIITSQPGTVGLLDHVQVGALNTLQDTYEYAYFSGYGINLATVFISFLVGIIIFFLWLLRREGEYLWFAIVNLVAGFSYLNNVIVSIPISTYLWECVMQVSIGWIPALMAVFIHFLIGHPWPRSDRIICALGFGFIPLIFLVEPQSIFLTAKFWHGIAFIGGVAALIELIIFLKREKSGALYLVWGCILLISISGGHDLITVHSGVSQPWLTYTPILMTMGILSLLVHRFAMNSRALEQTNLTLEMRVAEAQKKIENDMRLIADMERHQAILQERSRIFRDLHDDLGAKILSLVYKSENNEQRTLAREAMTELRKIIESGDSEEIQCKSMMLIWRKDCVKRGIEAGVSISWPSWNTATEIILSPEVATQVSFVLREAMTNALKYRSGKNIYISMRYSDNCMLISIKNDVDSECIISESGHGIKNMKKRIASLGGVIRWKTYRSKKCCVLWAIPLNHDKSIASKQSITA